MIAERPVVFACGADSLIGIVHPAPTPSRRGVLIVVGGPQYRVGSHRQFLHLARHLAASGVPAMRMDYRGMGDSDGEYLGFEYVGDDIRAAIDAFQDQVPALEEVVLWGLCDAASAITFYARRDARVCGIVLLNPWVRTPAGEARAYIRHYYLKRLADRAFWRKLFAGGINPITVVRSFLDLAAAATGGNEDDSRPAAADETGAAPSQIMPRPPPDGRPLPERMLEALEAYRGQVLLITSGRDLTAREFEDAAAASRRWRRALRGDRVRRRVLKDADHTFSRRAWKEEVAAATAEWLRAW